MELEGAIMLVEEKNDQQSYLDVIPISYNNGYPGKILSLVQYGMNGSNQPLLSYTDVSLQKVNPFIVSYQARIYGYRGYR